MASASSPIGHNLTSNSNQLKATRTLYLTLLSHTYLSHIDQWYTDLTDQSRGTISRYPPISRMQHFLNANFKCRDQQVHGITFEVLDKIIAAASRHELDDDDYNLFSII